MLHYRNSTTSRHHPQFMRMESGQATKPAFHTGPIGRCRGRHLRTRCLHRCRSASEDPRPQAGHISVSQTLPARKTHDVHECDAKLGAATLHNTDHGHFTAVRPGTSQILAKLVQAKLRMQFSAKHGCPDQATAPVRATGSLENLSKLWTTCEADAMKVT